eukprot:TRINITY_DN44_c0_g5_i1.p1 TRINITY_DN44_c0_g5~~TRINITY_DN44_c0_g5_i1.p1  ORF type:complete len:364 (-),score=98.43 TRINITY_DN44_c0_g5_i1:1253-2344(-)
MKRKRSRDDSEEIKPLESPRKSKKTSKSCLSPTAEIARQCNELSMQDTKPKKRGWLSKFKRMFSKKEKIDLVETPVQLQSQQQQQQQHQPQRDTNETHIQPLLVKPSRRRTPPNLQLDKSCFDNNASTPSTELQSIHESQNSMEESTIVKEVENILQSPEKPVAKRIEPVMGKFAEKSVELYGDDFPEKIGNQDEWNDRQMMIDRVVRKLKEQKVCVEPLLHFHIVMLGCNDKVGPVFFSAIQLCLSVVEKTSEADEEMFELMNNISISLLKHMGGKNARMKREASRGVLAIARKKEIMGLKVVARLLTDEDLPVLPRLSIMRHIIPECGLDDHLTSENVMKVVIPAIQVLNIFMYKTSKCLV